MTARLILEDGTIFSGTSFGFPVSTAGEVVFNTGMVGYPESLTDPSYFGQILVFTYPLIGNYGVPKDEVSFKERKSFLKFFEARHLQITGLVVSDYVADYSHFQAVKDLASWLKEEKIPALTDVDTRALTQYLRQRGTMLGRLLITNSSSVKVAKERGQDKNRQSLWYDPNQENVVAQVSITRPLTYSPQEFYHSSLESSEAENLNSAKKRVIIIDCGCKFNIIRSFLKKRVEVKLVPWNFDLTKEEFDGLVISNGPGDPRYCRSTIRQVTKLLRENKPILGICLGSQILALAAGAKIYKLLYGHRSQNQPCLDNLTGRCYLTTQNHGFAIKAGTLSRDWQVWFTNVNDKTIEGIKHMTKPFWGVQFHPEANPGPMDTNWIFDEFIKLL